MARKKGKQDEFEDVEVDESEENPPSGEGTKVKIVRGYFPADGSRKLEPGEVVDLPAEEANALLESGAAEAVTEAVTEGETDGDNPQAG